MACSAALVIGLLLVLPDVAGAQEAPQPTLSGSRLIGSFTTTGFLCGSSNPTFYQSSGEVTPETSPYYPGTFTQQGSVFDGTGNFTITTSVGTTITGFFRSPMNGGCSRGGSTNIFSAGASPDRLSGGYVATITTADGRRFSDAGSAFAAFVGGTPDGRNLVGQSRLSFSSQFSEARPISGAHLTLTESASVPSGQGPLAETYTYTLLNNGSETLFHVSLSASACSPATYRSGDDNGDTLLQPGEMWTFSCSRTFATSGTYVDQATARGTSTQTGLPAISNTSQTTVNVVAGSGAGGSEPVSGPRMSLRAATGPSSGPAPLTVQHRYDVTNEGTDVLFGVSVGSDVCSPVAYGVGDADGDQLFDPGETWVFTCVRIYGTPGEYTESSTARATNTQTGLAVVSGPAVALVSVTGDGGGDAAGGGAPGPRISLSESTSPSSGAAPLTVEHRYTLINDGTDVLFGVSVTSDSCSPVMYRSGDADRDELLDPGETWTFACSRTYAAAGEYVDNSTAKATNTQTGLAVLSGTAHATVSVFTGGGGGGGNPGARMSLSAATSPSSGAAPLAVEHRYSLINDGTDVLFGVSVTSDTCSPAVYRSGDADRDELLDPGETWTFACSRTYAAAGEYADNATARATNTLTGLEVISGTAHASVSVFADGGS